MNRLDLSLESNQQDGIPWLIEAVGGCFIFNGRVETHA